MIIPQADSPGSHRLRAHTTLDQETVGREVEYRTDDFLLSNALKDKSVRAENGRRRKISG